MKKNITLIVICLLFVLASGKAQCTGQTTYDLTVSGTTIQHPATNSFLSAVVCSGGVLIDSSTCCTRFVHVLSGGTYQMGGSAYAFVMLQNGATFIGSPTANVFGLSYETGANIINYSGPMTICPSITFSPSSCSSVLVENNSEPVITAFYESLQQSLLVSGINSRASLQIFDITGKLMMKETVNENQENRFDLSMLNSGVYTYLIQFDSKESTHGKFIIAK